MNVNIPVKYQEIVAVLKNKIRAARVRATLRLNSDLLMIYREIGAVIAEQERDAGWGAKVVENLSRDLKSEFQDMKGLSPRNPRYMRDFALAYPQFPFLQAPLAKTPEDKFDFIYLGREAKERDLEDALTSQMKKFLLELGEFFSFMGEQYRMTLGEEFVN